MYPDDRHFCGIKKTFSGIMGTSSCPFMSKCKPTFHYAALVPISCQDATEGFYYFLLANDGFNIIHLPYTSYVRHVDFKDWNSLEIRN